MSIMKQLHQQLDELGRVTDKRTKLSAKLGNGQGVVSVENRPGYVYARLQLSSGKEQVTHVYAPNVRRVNNHPVTVKLNEHGFYQTTGTDPVSGPGFFGGFGIGEVGPHQDSHGYYGDDMLWLDTRQITELLVHPTSPASLSVTVNAGLIKTIAGWASLLTSDEDLTALIPTTINQQRIIVIGIDRSDGSITTIESTPDVFTGYTPESVPFTTEDVADLINAEADAYFEPLMALRAYFGQTQFQKWDCFKDCRGWGRQGVNPFETTDTSDWVGYPFFNNGNLYVVRCTGEATAPPTVNDDETLGYQIGSWWAMSVTAGGLFDGKWFCTDATDGAAVWTFQGQAYSTANTGNPPTDSDLDTAFGAPNTLGVGFQAIVNDNGAGTNVYLVQAVGSAWFIQALTLAV